MILGEFVLSPKCLYPTEGIFDIDSKRIDAFYEAYKCGKGQQIDIIVIRYDGELYIYAGHEQVVAATNFGLNEVKVIEIDRAQLKYWSNDAQFTSTLQAIGMTAIYDFEAIGAFKYEKYPIYYCKTTSN